MSNYKSFDELTREQIVELKQCYLHTLDEEGTLNEVLYDDPDDDRGLTWGELANADALVPDELVRRQHEGVVFTDDDFFCTAGKGEEVAA